MSTVQQPSQAPQSTQNEAPIEPGHVMTREQYEDLARKAAGQK